MATMSYWQIDPFFPKFLKDRNLDKALLGFGKTVCAVSMMISSSFVAGCVLKYITRIQGCFVGAIMVITFLLGIGCLEYIEDNDLVVICYFIFQTIGGFGSGINTTCSYAIVTSQKENR
jgi:hypothetical protein